jgi:hypothetical protein
MAIGDTGTIIVLYGASYLVLGTAGGTLVYAIKQGEPMPATCYVIDTAEIPA